MNKLRVESIRLFLYVSFIVLVDLSIDDVHGKSTGIMYQPNVPGVAGHPPDSIWDQKVNIPLWGRLLIVGGGLIVLIAICFCYMKVCRRDK